MMSGMDMLQPEDRMFPIYYTLGSGDRPWAFFVIDYCAKSP